MYNTLSNSQKVMMDNCNKILLICKESKSPKEITAELRYLSIDTVRNQINRLANSKFLEVSYIKQPKFNKLCLRFKTKKTNFTEKDMLESILMIKKEAALSKRVKLLDTTKSIEVEQLPYGVIHRLTDKNHYPKLLKSSKVYPGTSMGYSIW